MKTTTAKNIVYAENMMAKERMKLENLTFKCEKCNADRYVHTHRIDIGSIKLACISRHCMTCCERCEKSDNPIVMDKW